MREGEGFFCYPNKDRYSGQWQGGKKHGPGTYILAQSGERLKGEWCAGQLIRGEWELPNGQRFSGEFNAGRPDGPGQWHIQGKIYSGRYVDENAGMQPSTRWPIKNDLGLDEDRGPVSRWVAG